MKECDLMNTEFSKAVIYAGPAIHAVGLVINIQERSSLKLQLMIRLLRKLKIDLKHIVLIATHGDALLPEPFPEDLRRRCKMRCDRLLLDVQGLECMAKLLRDIENRFIVVENSQLCERSIILEQLFRYIESIAAHPMTNDTFHKALEWWNNQTVKHMKEEGEINEARNRLLRLQRQCTMTNLQNLKSKHNCLEEELSTLTSILDKVKDIENTLAQMKQCKYTTELPHMQKELRRIESEEYASRKREERVKELKGKLRRSFEKEVKDFMSACANVISHREEGINTLEKAADKIDRLMRDATAARVAGYSAGIIGAVTFTVGTGLLLGGITLPVAIPLLAIGGTVGAAGSATAIGGTVGQLVKKSKIMKRANTWLKENKRRCENLIHTHDMLMKERGRIIELFPSSETEFELPQGMQQITLIISTWKDVMKHSGPEATHLVLNAAGSGLGVAQGLLHGIETGAEASALAAKVAANAAGGVAVGLSAVVILIDLGFLIKSSYDLDRRRRGYPTKPAQALMDLASAVTDENNLLRDAHSHCTTRSGDNNGHASLVICNPSLDNEEQLLNGLPVDHESGLNNRDEVLAMSGDDASHSCEEDEIVDHDSDHDSDDQSGLSLSMIILEAAEDEDPSTVHPDQSNVSINDMPETDVSDTTDGHFFVIS